MICHADSLPGTVLHANLGDEIEVTIDNLSQEQVIDMYWHGLPMVRSGLHLEEHHVNHVSIWRGKLSP